MSFHITKQPTVEPVTLQQLKDHLRIYHTEEDSLLETYLKAARMYAETTLCWRAFVEQEIEYIRDSFLYEIKLPRPPLRSVQSITYKDTTGAENTIEPVEYIVDTDSEPARIVPAYDKNWPTSPLYPVNAVKVSYTAGYPSEEIEAEGEAVGIGDDSETEFSLDFFPVVTGSETIYLDGMETGGYTLDYDTGKITFSTAPGEDVAVTADYKYKDYRYNVPTEIKQGILILAGHFFEVREPVVIGTSVMVVPFTVEALLMPYRAWGCENL